MQAVKSIYLLAPKTKLPDGLTLPLLSIINKLDGADEEEQVLKENPPELLRE